MGGVDPWDGPVLFNTVPGSAILGRESSEDPSGTFTKYDTWQHQLA